MPLMPGSSKLALASTNNLIQQPMNTSIAMPAVVPATCVYNTSIPLNATLAKKSIEKQQQAKRKPAQPTSSAP